MVGIYKITNNITGRIYIGQSKNIERRFLDHNTPGHISEAIDKNITFYGKENFTYEVLEECEIDQLDTLEDKYIKEYRDQQIPMYNKLLGGQSKGFRCGENNGNAKLTEQDVYDIRESYKNHECRGIVYQKYKDKTDISESYFNSLWQGQHWTTVHMDVYTPENLEYYIGRKLSLDEVYELRKRYVNETLEEIYESVKDRISLSTLKHILYGDRYKSVPVYHKSTQTWLNN